jgi:hypothetical protein
VVIDPWASQQAMGVFDDLEQVAFELMQLCKQGLENGRRAVV